MVPVKPVLCKHWSFFVTRCITITLLHVTRFLLLHFSVVAKNVNCVECTDAVVDVLVTLDFVVPLRRL